MELRLLRNFLSVSDYLNITKASKHLHLSQPALSRQIKEIEEEFGLPLFTRHAAGLQLTGPGKFLVGEARSLLERTDLLVKTMTAFANPEDARFAIGYDPGAISQKLFGTLARFGSHHPKIQMSIREHSAQQLFEALRSDSVDVAVIPISQRAIPSDFGSLVVSQEPLSLVVSTRHPFAKRSAIKLSDMAEEVLVSYQDDLAPSWQEYVFDACKLAGFRPERLIKVNSYSAMLLTIAGGKGYGLLPKVLGTNLLQAVTSIPVMHPIIKMDTCAIWRRTSRSQCLPLFLEVLATGRESTSATA